MHVKDKKVGVGLFSQKTSKNTNFRTMAKPSVSVQAATRAITCNVIISMNDMVIAILYINDKADASSEKG
jgi:hypothetical protein